jgi:hypothetical protein
MENLTFPAGWADLRRLSTTTSTFSCGMSLYTSKLHALKENDAPNYKYLENKKLAIHPTMRKYRLVEMVGKFPIGLGIFPDGPSVHPRCGTCS